MTLIQAAVQHAIRACCHLDVETFSECNLKECGLYKYAEDESTELLVVCYKFAGRITAWVPRATVPPQVVALFKVKFPGAKLVVQLACPLDLRYHIEDGLEVRAHNAQFERVVLNGVAGQKVEFPKLSIDQMVCTAAKMSNHGLPRALGDAAKALGTHGKDDTGRANMLALSQPRRGKERRYTPENSPERFVLLYTYCCDDVLAEEGIDKVVPDITPEEARVYRLDQQINDRGVTVDLKALADIQILVDEYKAEIEAEFLRLTGVRPTQREKVAAWVRANGFPQLLDMQAETVKALCDGPACPANVKLVLRMYSTYGMKAVTKYEAFKNMVCKDGKVHGMFLYYGAGTGRWSSTGVQLQNMFRSVIDDPDTAIESFKQRDLQWVKDLYPGVDPMKVFASCLRGMLIASPGNVLIFPDFAGVESRVNAWLWGEEWKLKAFREFDAGTGPDLYCVTYGRVFQVDPRAISKKDPRRQLGKVKDLAFGYEGGVSALITWAVKYGIDLDEVASLVPAMPDDVIRSANWMWDRFGPATGLKYSTYIACDGIKQLWRQGHPGIKAGWKQLNNAAKMAIFYPGKTYRAGMILFKVVDQWLYMKLPSGRRIAYFRPSLDYGKHEDEETADMLLEKAPVERMEDELDNATVRYWGVDTNTRRYMKTHTYGGKEDENAVQGFSRDLLVHGLLELDGENYPAVGSVHDEGLLEVPENYGSLEEANRIICRQPPYAVGLPIAVEGHRSHRYKK